MSVARVLVKQADVIYRFLKFETRPDGSLLIFLDRDPSPLLRAMTACEDGTFVPDNDPKEGVAPHAKISCHTTGEVRWYPYGEIKNKFYIEPLHKLSKPSAVGYFSIPRVSLLDRLDEKEHHHDVSEIFEIPENVEERITFAFELFPCAPVELSSLGVSLNYEVYSAVVRLVPNPVVPSTMADYFLHGTPKDSQFSERQMDQASAELGFHQHIHGQGHIVFREGSGAYVLLAKIPMRIAPRLTITFDRADLRIEPIPFVQIRDPTHGEPTHKVRFWIRDRTGRNKNDDLRKHITSIELDARL